MLFLLSGCSGTDSTANIEVSFDYSQWVWERAEFGHHFGPVFEPQGHDRHVQARFEISNLEIE